MKTIAGTLFVLFILAITWALWLSEINFTVFTDIPLVALSRALSLTGIVLMSLTLMLSTRNKIVEKIFWGLDRVYTAHHVMGSLAFIFLINHPLLLIVNSIPYYQLITRYFLPSTDLAYTLGVCALYVMMLSFTFMIFIKVSYQAWLFSHRFMTLSFVLGGVHALLISSDVATNQLLRGWISFFVFMGTVSGIYMLAFYHRLGPRFVYRVDNTIKKFQVIDIYLSPVHRKMKYLPGQFVYARILSRQVSRELHPFSISNADSENQLRISVKTAGDYTKKLELITPGTQVYLYGPYGRFGDIYQEAKSDMVWIAGGIGITPFLGMLHKEAMQPCGRKIYFCYSYKTADENVFIQELQTLLEYTPNVALLDWNSAQYGRVTADKLAKAFGQSFNLGQKIMICGPMPMMTSLQEQFESMGVLEENIIFEKFALI